MRISKRILACGLTVAMVSSIPALASEAVNDSVLASHVLEQVTNLYSDVYNVSNTKATITNMEYDDNGDLTVTIDASFNRTLKVQSVDDMPYIQGLKAALSELTDATEIAVATNYLEEKRMDLNQYIGVPQDTNVELKVNVPSVAPLSASTSDIAIDDIVYIGMDDEVPASDLAPRSNVEVRQTALDDTAEIISTATVFQPRSTRAANSTIQKYDRVVARDYARKWSCTSSATTSHSSCHNPSYTFYDSNDCANFVSQCMYAGGLPKDSQWYPYSSYWKTTGGSGNGLRQYVTNNKLFFHSTNQYKACTGSIINWLTSSGANAGHVGLVDQNDTHTMTFCAHTKCRKSCPWTGENVDFYVPYWDSVSSKWITP